MSFDTSIFAKKMDDKTYLLERQRFLKGRWWRKMKSTHWLEEVVLPPILIILVGVLALLVEMNK